MSENLNNEQELLQRVARGDQEAFRAIFGQHYRSLCFFATSIITDRQEAEDIVQDVFSRFWDKRGDFPTASAVKAFLYISTKNACLNYLKLRERRNEREQAFVYLHEHEAGAAFDPVLAETEIIGELYREIENLPAQCRRVFTLSYLEGRKNEEIAGSLGISYNTVRTQKLRALKLIRSGLLKKNLLPALMAYLAFLKGIN
ncbi:RNA polymerase sigma-70 factor [Chitinophaga sp. GCM10012297]|uniref:RNA polymerase sigma-70 factor n=1 Tax=Chitinophaga chungangae TaxID=2821488 RepID=A0ABS3YC66_9BACT|nr:RNA polymerase sigma-70 factor [Chitinophaga chungangae]MBO9152251.1 RNA polymerase sigma-70 factor [Chitinophaga chungangae]